VVITLRWASTIGWQAAGIFGACAGNRVAASMSKVSAGAIVRGVI
jgi:hypothetical protein